MRRVVSTVAFGVHRVRADGARSALVAAGVAAAGLLLAAVLLGSLVAQERALADSVDALAPPVTDRARCLVRRPGTGRRLRRPRLAVASRPRLGHVGNADRDGALPREQRRRAVRIARRRRWPRAVGARDERASAQNVHERACARCCSSAGGAHRQGGSSSSGAACSVRQRCSATQCPRSATSSTVRGLPLAFSASSATTSLRRRRCCSQKACGVWRRATCSPRPIEATAG